MATSKPVTYFMKVLLPVPVMPNRTMTMGSSGSPTATRKIRQLSSNTEIIIPLRTVNHKDDGSAEFTFRSGDNYYTST
jgi:hypothetical protein